MRRVALCCSLVLASVAISAQQQPTFKSRVQVVEVDARVFDKDGRFVRDLTKDDFEVLENGVPQTVDASYLIVAPPAGGGPALLLPGVDADRAPGVPAASQTWIFAFDLNHLAPGTGFERARKAVEDFIAKRFRDGDLAGIVAGERMVNNRLTSVRSELLEAVKTVKPRSDVRNRLRELTQQWPRFLDEEEAIRVARNERDVVERVIGRACSDDPSACEKGRSPDLEVKTKGLQFQQEIYRDTEATLRALHALASGLAKMPGPKTIVFLSAGFVSMNVEASVQSVVGQVTRAGGRVYAIDVRGLDRSGGAIIDRQQAPDPYGAVPTFDMNADGSNSLAIDTGGMMIRNENNIGRALDRIADDGGTYYVLAYQPTDANFDGKFRATQVRVKRPGVIVRARRGYLALDPAKMLKPHAITRSGTAVAPITTITRDTFEVPPVALTPVPPPADPAVPVTTGAVVATPAATTAEASSVRLRPDSENRVKALSARDVGKPNEWITRGWDAYQRGDVETALENFTQAATRGTVRPWVVYALGMSQAAVGRTADAVASWERVKDAAPDFEPVYMDLADTYAQMGELSRALATLREAEKRWPASGDVQGAIGVILVRRGALDDAVGALTKAAEARPDDPLSWLNLARTYELRFHRGRRYVTSQRRWVAPEDDRKRAAQAYERCITLGGPYAIRAKEALSALEWSKQGT